MKSGIQRDSSSNFKHIYRDMKMFHLYTSDIVKDPSKRYKISGFLDGQIKQLDYENIIEQLIYSNPDIVDDLNKGLRLFDEYEGQIRFKFVDKKLLQSTVLHDIMTAYTDFDYVPCMVVSKTESVFYSFHNNNSMVFYNTQGGNISAQYEVIDPVLVGLCRRSDIYKGRVADVDQHQNISNLFDNLFEVFRYFEKKNDDFNKYIENDIRTLWNYDKIIDPNHESNQLSILLYYRTITHPEQYEGLSQIYKNFLPNLWNEPQLLRNLIVKLFQLMGDKGAIKLYQKEFTTEEELTKMKQMLSTCQIVYYKTRANPLNYEVIFPQKPLNPIQGLKIQNIDPLLLDHRIFPSFVIWFV